MGYFLGLWAIIESYAVAFILLGIFVALGLLTSSMAAIPFIGPFLVKFEQLIQKAAIIAAAIIGAWILGNSMGIYNEAARCKLQTDHAKRAAIVRGATAHTRASRAANSVRAADPQDTDKR